METDEETPGAHAHARRAGRREANLRTLNEKIAVSQDELADDSVALTLLCECAMDGCDETIELTQVTFAYLREQLTRFAVVDGHILYDVEQVVQTGEGWVIVEKFGEAARAAREELS